MKEILLCYGYLEKKNLKKFKEVMNSKKITIDYRYDYSVDAGGTIEKRLTIVLTEHSNKSILSILDYNKIDYSSIDEVDLFKVYLTDYGATLKDRIVYILTKDIDIYSNVYGEDFFYNVKIKTI